MLIKQANKYNFFIAELPINVQNDYPQPQYIPCQMSA
jgi:hypothetical protein